MKKFNVPELEVIRFNSADGLTAEILAASDGSGNGGPNESEILRDGIVGDYE